MFQIRWVSGCWLPDYNVGYQFMSQVADKTSPMGHVKVLNVRPLCSNTDKELGDEVVIAAEI